MSHVYPISGVWDCFEQRTSDNFAYKRTFIYPDDPCPSECRLCPVKEYVHKFTSVKAEDSFGMNFAIVWFNIKFCVPRK